MRHARGIDFAAGDKKAALSRRGFEKLIAGRFRIGREFIACFDCAGIQLAQPLQQPAGDKLDIQDVVIDRARPGKRISNLGRVKLRPENSGRIQQKDAAVERDLLLAARDAGTVARFGGFSSGEAVDKA